jgi:hypothetical protein
MKAPGLPFISGFRRPKWLLPLMITCRMNLSGMCLSRHRRTSTKTDWRCAESKKARADRVKTLSLHRVDLFHGWFNKWLVPICAGSPVGNKEPAGDFLRFECYLLPDTVCGCFFSRPGIQPYTGCIVHVPRLCRNLHKAEAAIGFFQSKFCLKKHGVQFDTLSVVFHRILDFTRGCISMRPFLCL